MEERKTNPSAESTPEQPVQTDGRAMLEQAFARGSGHLNEVQAPPPERAEHSVMEGLPPAKAERVAAMRRELAELQRQLSDAQQRIATELQGRAEDAERFEALEARLQAHEAKTQQDTTRTTELETEIASLRSQLSTVAATAEELRKEVASRDTQLEEARRQHRGATEQLEAHTSSLNETKTLLATRDGELAAKATELEEQRKQHGEATTQLESERDALKGELANARAKMRDVATQLARFGQDLTDGAPVAPTTPSSESSPAIAVKSAERPKPPPVPSARTTQPQPQQVILEVTEEPKSRSRIALALIGGVLLGCVVTMAVVKWTGSSSTTAAEHDVAASPASALASERVVEPTSPPAAGAPAVAAPETSPAEPTPVAGTDVKAAASDDSASRPAPAAATTTDGVIVLPQEAADHRVFVDGKVVPVKNSRAVVPCGSHEVRIGSRGAPRTLDVACGGETTLPVEPR
jgi:predicted  nucleic acid-binding Zn-ribbon protein